MCSVSAAKATSGFEMSLDRINVSKSSESISDLIVACKTGELYARCILCFTSSWGMFGFQNDVKYSRTSPSNVHTKFS